ncbi:hypothetical protein H4S07_003684, partial [Coemansia furcata]
NFSVHVGLDQSIEDLKQSIESSHQATPQARGMRIIWKGRVLEDTDVVRSIYTDSEASEAQTVHFVLNSPASMPSVPKKPFAWPIVVPLGKQFQYVLVDGVPYLMVLPPVGTAQSDTYSFQEQQQQQLSAALVGENSGEMQTLERLNAHLEMRNRMLQELEETSARLERLMALNRGRERGRRGGVERGHRAANNEADNGHPLADVLRNFNFRAIWSTGWMLLRMLLLVVVLAHDASLDRILVLAVVVCSVFALRSPWIQQRLMWVNQQNNYIDAQTQGDDADDRRQFTAWEKCKALLVALFTSLVPSEPFQPPVVAEE